MSDLDVRNLFIGHQIAAINRQSLLYLCAAIDDEYAAGPRFYHQLSHIAGRPTDISLLIAKVNCRFGIFSFMFVWAVNLFAILLTPPFG